jgi:hypothetical protein
VNAPIVVAYGAGLNSSAMLVGLVERQAPIDLVLFADTGAERPETYRYLDLMSGYLVEHGYPAIEIVRYTTRAGDVETLEQRCLDREMLPSLAYGFKKCSQRFKVQPQNKRCNNWAPARAQWNGGGLVTKLIGIDAGEPRRAKIKTDSKYSYLYPLIEWGWHREDCEEALTRAGLPVATKSSCFFCPAARLGDIQDLKRKHPDLLARALAMERNAMGNLSSVKGLGRRFSWSEFVRSDAAQVRLFKDPIIDQSCVCFDEAEA